jgi:hypothetical protein
MPEGRIGFCHYLFGKGKETRITSAEVRLLPRDFAPDPPPSAPAAADAASLKHFEGESAWTGEIKLGPGYYKPGYKAVIGVEDKKEPKKTQAGKVTSQRGAEIDGADIFIKKGEWSADGTLFRSTKVTMELGGKLEAKDSLFDRCDLHKGGGWFVKLFSTKWVFRNCVFARSFINPWKLVDIGVQATNCTFYDVDFSKIQYRDDAGKEAADEWVAMKNCRFVRCKVPESVLLATRECVFEACKFGPAEDKLPGATPVSTVVYTGNAKDAPAAGQGRTIEVKDAKSVPHPAGATLPHQYKNRRLGFTSP